MVRKWYTPDPEHPGWTIVRYRRAESEEQRKKRQERSRAQREMEEEIMSDPMTAYLYEKELEAERRARRWSRQPQYHTYSHKQLVKAALASIGNDGMPVILKKTSGTAEITSHQALKEIRRAYRPSRAQKRARAVEQRANEGDYTQQKFSPEFIQKIVNLRTSRGMTQKDLGQLVNETESVIRQFEKGELPFNGGLKSLLLWKMGL